MKRSEAFPSRYLGKDDVEQPILATIESVDQQEIDGEHGKEDKTVLHFSSDNIKPMICNGTNWDMIAGAYGDESDDWGGKVVEIYFDPNVMYGKKKTGGVRIRIPKAGKPGSTGVTWTLAQAVAACEKDGISKDDLKAELARLGLTKWNPITDTGKIQDFISARLFNGEAKSDEVTAEDIKF